MSDKKLVAGVLTALAMGAGYCAYEVDQDIRGISKHYTGQSTYSVKDGASFGLTFAWATFSKGMALISPQAEKEVYPLFLLLTTIPTSAGDHLIVTKRDRTLDI